MWSQFPPNFQNNPLEKNIPTDGQTTEPFFPNVFMNLPDDCTFFFSGRNYHSYQRPQTTGPFFSGCNYEPAETSKLVEPPQPFPLTAR
jgi:hypothetical protein